MHTVKPFWATKPNPGNSSPLPYLSAITFLMALLLMVFFTGTFDLVWQANDDLGMSMTAHGYGSVAQGSPHLLFSNVIWGHFVRLLPDYFGILGYSLATILALFFVTWALLYNVYQLGAGYLPGFLITVLIMAQAVITPQYTINAGLLTVAAITSLIVYARSNQMIHLFVACILAYAGYLVRANEFILVLGVCLPLIPWRILLPQKCVRIAFLLFCVIVAGSLIIDKNAYNDAQWTPIKKFGEVAFRLIDFGGVQHLKQHPDIMKKYGYSENDLMLISNRFMADPKVVDTQTLEAMLTELGPLPLQADNLSKGWAGVSALATRLEIIPLTLTALFFIFLFPRKQSVLALLLCLAALFTLGVIGRPGVFRVYYPLVCLLIVAPFLLDKGYWPKKNRMIAVFILLITCGINFKIIYDEQIERAKQIAQIRMDMAGLPDEVLIRWGAYFPSVLAYPILEHNELNQDLKFYAVGSRSLAPNTYAFIAENNEDGLISRLLSDEGLLFAGTTYAVFPYELLATYCMEHHQRQMQTIDEYTSQTIMIQRVRCIIPKSDDEALHD